MSTSHVLAATRSFVALVRGSAAARPSGFARPVVASGDVEVVVTRVVD